MRFPKSMNNFISGLLLGFLIYWFIFFFIVAVKNFETEREAIIYFILGGPPTWIIVGVIIIIQFISKLVKKVKYKALVINKSDNKIYYTNSNWDSDEMYEDSGIVWLFSTEAGKREFEEIKLKYAKYWNKKFLNTDTINIRYCPKIVWKRYSKYKIKNKELQEE